MILEHVLISIDPNRSAAYLIAFAEARPYVLNQPGCLSCRLLPKWKAPGEFLLLLEWKTRAHHTEGFRKSEAYREWSRILHPFYPKLPTVAYFENPG